MNTSGLNAPREFLVKNSHAILKFGAKMPANAIALAHFCLNYNTRIEFVFTNSALSRPT